MAKVTAEGGYSDQNLPADAAYEQPELPFEDAPEPVTGASGTEEGNYATYTVRDLVRACQAKGIAYSGPSGTLPKDELVARLSAQE